MAYPPGNYKSRRMRKAAQVPGAAAFLRPDRRARGGGLSAAERDDMPSNDFALPGKGEGKSGKGAGAYPVNDKKHARAALSRGAANASPKEDAKIKRKVHSKFPDIKIDGGK